MSQETRQEKSQENKSEIIQDALNFLDEEMVQDVESLRGYVQIEPLTDNSDVHLDTKKKGKTEIRWWRKGFSLAASVCLLIFGSWMITVGIFPQESKTESYPEKDTFYEKDTSYKEQNNVQNDAAQDVNEETARDDVNQEAANQESANQDGQDGIEDLENIEVIQIHPEAVKTGVTIPKMEVNLKKAQEGDVQADMMGFFILNGRSYIQYEFQQNYVEAGADFVGKQAGEITGMIDEWTEADGYVDGAGTYMGAVYEVKGVSPEFMLCMVGEDGSVETFIHHNAITLHKGSDLVDDWLGLRGNVEAVSLETSIHGQIAYGDLPLTEEEIDVFERFLDAFAEGEFVYIEEKLNHSLMDFYFVKEDGLRLRFRTLGDGYVSFPWLAACIQIDQGLYEEVEGVLMKYAE